MSQLPPPTTLNITSLNPVELTMTLPLDQNPAAVYLATLRPTGRRSQHHALDVMAEMVQHGQTALTLPWSELRYQHTAAIAAALPERGYSPATVKRSLSALRGVLKEAWNLRLMPSEEYQRAINLKAVRGETLPAGRALAGSELMKLMEVCWRDFSAAGARDAALIAVLYGAGLRRSEVVKLMLTDWDEDTGALAIRGAKGNKDRLVYLELAGAGQTLIDWILVRGTAPGPLFVAIHRSGQVIASRATRSISDQAVMAILTRRGTQANLKHFTPHDLRRTYIGDLLDAGADIATVQQLVGHAQVTTTARYDRRGEVAKHKAAGLLHVPYQRRQMSVGVVVEVVE